MKNRYALNVGYLSEQKDEVTSILNVESNVDYGIWRYELIINENILDYITIFLDILEDKYDQLEKIGITRNQITIWRVYEYDYQCNMEFEPYQLKRLGDNGIKLCISCYDVGDHDENIES